MQVASTLRGTIRRHPRGTAIVVLLIAVVGGWALYWFAPWNLFVDRRVDEALPGASAEVPAAAGSTVTGPTVAGPGNIGSSNYEIPPSLDLGDFETAVIWCRRFSVGFAVAPLGSSPS